MSDEKEVNKQFYYIIQTRYPQSNIWLMQHFQKANKIYIQVKEQQQLDQIGPKIFLVLFQLLFSFVSVQYILCPSRWRGGQVMPSLAAFGLVPDPGDFRNTVPNGLVPRRLNWRRGVPNMGNTCYLSAALQTLDAEGFALV